MQQANRAEQSTRTTHGALLPGRAPLNAFVINLCSSTSPVALTPPDHAGLKRFCFFVSRRREESRERFRLHMGYFETQEEAEKLLDIVREIYPGAWAGLAPGQKLRAAAAQAHAAASPTTTAAAVAPAPLPPVESTPAAAAPSPRPSAQAVSQPAGLLPPEAVARPVTVTAAVHADAAGDTVRVPISEAALREAAALVLVPDQGRRLPEGQTLSPEHTGATSSLKNVRAAIASLEDTSERAPVLRPIPELRPLVNAATVTPAVSRPAAADDRAPEISDSVVLAVLEQGAHNAPTSTSKAKRPAATSATSASDMRPAPAMPVAVRPVEPMEHPASEDEAQPRNEKPCYAVQLMWSVQPMDITQVPQLAIFGAYTLYGAEGNRDGRRWYGLRLGFFTDAVSAKQVAHYVRSEFSTVSVVPVTARERERAKLASGRPSAIATAPAPAPVPAKATLPAAPPKTGFEFIEDKGLALPQVAKPGSGSARPVRAAPGKRAKLRTQGATNGRAKTKPLTLEETLEILGAGELKMDDGRTPLINDPAVAHSRGKPAKNKASRLGRLFERLSERIGS